ncbi:MAG: hypothetical protein KatS3mg031_2345 [Chitinophagales bacterium]|nr:MAG: hypothetical protein KatS3mg031_2345 [Chitinophagales bacterium]
MKNILLAILSVTLTLLACEMALSYFSEFRHDDEKLWVRKGDRWGNCYPSNPGNYFDVIEKSRTGRTVYCVYYDEQRRREGYFPNREKELAIIGDSFVFGEGVKEEGTLGYLLATRWKEYNVINRGKPGADVTYARAAVKAILEQRPCIRDVIYFFNLNDAILSREVSTEQERIIDLQNVRWKRDSFFRKILAKSRIYRMWERYVVLQRETRLTIENYKDVYSAEKNQFGLDETFRILEEMNRLCRKNNVTLHIVIYPLLYKDLKGQYPFAAAHKTILSTCRQRGIGCLDAYEAFKNDYSMKPYIVHELDYHPNARANEKVASFVVANIKPSF